VENTDETLTLPFNEIIKVGTLLGVILDKHPDEFFLAFWQHKFFEDCLIPDNVREEIDVDRVYISSVKWKKR
jgi:hypothetical protein